MGHNLRIVLIAVLLVAAGCQKSDEAVDNAPGWELNPPARNATPVAATTNLPGIYPVGSRIKDKDAIGGFGPCDNFPENLAGQDWGAKGTVAVVAFLEEPVAYFKHRGFALRVVNRTSETVPFAALDSALFLVREAQDEDGVWREIETLPHSSCGNGDHRVFLGPGQYWEFPAREYTGPAKTKLRFRLDPGGGQPSIYSSEFDGQVAAAHFFRGGW